MNENPSRGRWFVGGISLFILLGAMFFIGPADAAPTVLPVASSAVAVASADTFSFSSGVTGGATAPAAGSTWTIVAPNGQQMQFQRTSATSSTDNTQTWTLGGVETAGGAGSWTSSGSLLTQPADGTWTIHLVGTAYSSQDVYAGAGTQPGPTLTVAGRSIHFGAGTTAPATELQSWNWRSTAASATWTEPSTTGSTPLGPTTIDSPNEAAQEDPNNAVYFQSASGSTASPYSAFTLTATVTCGTSPTMTLTGAWVGATGTTFTHFVAKDGNLAGAPDLSSLPGITTTAEVNQGATASGTTTQAGVAYDNAAGTSYQFFVRATLGTTMGAVLYAPNGQCAQGVPTIAIADLHHEDTFHLTASQAQCKNDAVAFSMDIEIGNVLTIVGSESVKILDAKTGTTIDTIATAQFFTVGNKVSYAARVLPPGAYTAIGQLTLTGVNAGTYYSSAAVSVPAGDCISIAQDLTAILTLESQAITTLNSVAANSTAARTTVNCAPLLQAHADGGSTDLVRCVIQESLPNGLERLSNAAGTQVFIRDASNSLVVSAAAPTEWQHGTYFYDYTPTTKGSFTVQVATVGIAGSNAFQVTPPIEYTIPPWFQESP